MAEIPHAVLSDNIQEILSGRRLRSAVFLTFTFEPDFFEQEILPAAMPGIPRSQVAAIRLLQLEDALKSVDGVAVYYDRAGLIAGAESAKLDVRRIATHHRTGCFHPKNIFLLTENVEPNEHGERGARLTVASLSANLTRAGWWENVEACHIEEVDDRQPCGFRDDLLDLIKSVKAATPSESRHEALDAIKRFVTRLAPRQNRRSNGILFPRLYCGKESVDEFLSNNLGEKAEGACLEVISPYFNKNDLAPLELLRARFNPREVRIFLPRKDDGSAQCERELYNLPKLMPNTVWSKLPTDLLRAGKQEQMKRRRVHAKVYRLFNSRTRYEALFIGSVNLTTSAHSKNGNLESAFLIETSPVSKPDWWLEVDSSRPSFFAPMEDGEEASAETPLAVRFDWSSQQGEVFWDATRPAGTLRVNAQGATVLQIDNLRHRQWTSLAAAESDAIQRVLASTSFLTVSEDEGPEAIILVQEEGMAHKPSLLANFTAADILRWWTLLTIEQRSAALEDKYELIPEALIQLGIDVPPLPPAPASLFATFTGIYHAFSSLEKAIQQVLGDKHAREAEYRLLGKKYDSLPSLLDRMKRHSSERDAVEQYLIALCAQQVVDSITKDFSWFLKDNRALFRSLRKQIRDARRISRELPFESNAERDEFLEWFEQWFLKRASRHEQA